MEYRYKGLQVTQTDQAKKLVLFAASAFDIQAWAGVPQKQRLQDGNETIGFQRDENEARVESLSEFYRNEANIIQNALLGATRETKLGTVSFESSGEDDDRCATGDLVIDLPDHDSTSLTELFGNLRSHLESRVTEFGSQDVTLTNRFRELKTQAATITTPEEESGLAGQEDGEFEEPVVPGDEEDSVDAPLALLDESHIYEFWVEVASRHELLKELAAAAPQDKFLGFDRSVLLSYLLPVVLVDGQHRLSGAMEAAKRKLDTDPLKREIRDRIDKNERVEDVENDIIARECRILPMSLLLSSDPEEQVFQFVVVNQKATPIGRALLGTIVSTTLSVDEIGKVSTRLQDAGIPLEESRATTYLARSTESPFYNLVERGMTGDSKDLLQWTALSSLIRIFRLLVGGKLYGHKNDYAKIWRDRCLADSPIVQGYGEKGYDSPFEYWASNDGPWRECFIAFFSAVRDRLASTDNPERWNYWGRPRQSNLFNKVSLTILTADFFEYMAIQRSVLDAAASIASLVDKWLQDVNKTYFDRDWGLSGVKRDSTGIRNQWADLWQEHRKGGGTLPAKAQYKKIKGA